MIALVGIGTLPRDLNLIEKMLNVAGIRETVASNQASVIVACGEEALQQQLGMQGIAARRGSAWKQEDGRWVVPIRSPREIYEKALWQEVVIGIRCLERALCIDQGKESGPFHYEESVESGAAAITWLSRIEQAHRWAIDLETIPGKGKKAVVQMLGVAIETGEGIEAFAVPWPSKQVWAVLGQLIGQYQSSLVGHNLTYDLAWIGEQVEIGLVAPYMDTMQAWHLKYPDFPKTLEFAAMWECGTAMPYWKDERKHRGKRSYEEQVRHWQYVMKDCVATLLLSQRLPRPSESALGNWQVALGMQQHALRCDQEIVEQCVREAEKELLEVTTAIGGECNPASPKQVRRTLESLGYRLPTKQGKVIVGEEALCGLRAQQQSPLLDALIARKALQRSVEGMVELVGQESVRMGWIPDSTVTYEYASAPFPCGGTVDLYVLPRQIRRAVRAPERRVLVQVTLRYPELRFLEARTGCLPLNEQEESVILAAAYRLGPKAWAVEQGITMREAQRLLGDALANYPEIRQWQGQVKEQLKKTSQLVNVWGQKWECMTGLGQQMATGVIGDPVWREALQWESYSTLAGIVSEMCRLLSRQEGIWIHGRERWSVLASVPEYWWAAGKPIPLPSAIVIQGRVLNVDIEAIVTTRWEGGQL